MDKRYQVFVSSTFEDLREERSAVIGALLQLDCIPAGMELFPAADDDSWTLIKSVIDDCDYYVAIIAGRYGSTPAGSSKSYTRMEYEYAKEKRKPTIALIHSNPSNLVASKFEQSEEGRKRLDEFRKELKSKNCRHWVDRSDLISGLTTGVNNLKKTRPDGGWVKSSELTDAANRASRLRDQVNKLTVQLYEAEQGRLLQTACEPATGDDKLEIAGSLQALSTILQWAN